jgi:integrase
LPPIKVKHLAAITDPNDVGALLRAMTDYQGTLTVRVALRLAPLTFVRPGELRKAEWSEIDLDKAEWCIPAERMKMKEPHIVPLSRQAVAILGELHALTGSGRYVFPSPRSTTRPMSDNAVLSALRRMGYGKEEMTGHGFRAMARTILDEVLGFRVDIIEHQLAHAVKDPNGRAYNRTKHLDERRRMMQAWADYLDAREHGAQVLPFKRKPAN